VSGVEEQYAVVDDLHLLSPLFYLPLSA